MLVTCIDALTWEDSLTIFCGIDWAERHHDIALVDDTGTLLAKARITDNTAGYNKLLELLAEHGDSPDTPIPVAIETSHGLLVATLPAGNRKVFAINPLAASRYRDRHGVSRKKSDPCDALVLANILRTDMAMHRPMPADSELAQAITVLARAQQDTVWSRQQIANQVRSMLRKYYPAALLPFQQEGRPDPARRPAHPRPVAGRPQTQRPHPLLRHGSRTPAGHFPRRVRLPDSSGRGRLRQAAAGPSHATHCGLPRRGRPRSRR